MAATEPKASEQAEPIVMAGLQWEPVSYQDAERRLRRNGQSQPVKVTLHLAK